jgi:hypothetical protein
MKGRNAAELRFGRREHSHLSSQATGLIEHLFIGASVWGAGLARC